MFQSTSPQRRARRAGRVGAPLGLLGLALCLLPGLAPALMASSQTSITNTQDELISWVETKKAIAESQAEWSAEKEIVTDLIALLTQEKEKYEAGIEALSESEDATDQKRTELNAERERLLAASEELKRFIPELEAQTRELVEQMPAPLTAELAPLIRRLPEPDAETQMPVSQRLLTVVGILNRIDKFNTAITIESEIRNTGDVSSEVTTLYFGLAGAYFANSDGSYAGIGVPGENGWEWSQDASIAGEIVALIRSYEGATEARFVELPVQTR